MARPLSNGPALALSLPYILWLRLASWLAGVSGRFSRARRFVIFSVRNISVFMLRQGSRHRSVRGALSVLFAGVVHSRLPKVYVSSVKRPSISSIFIFLHWGCAELGPWCGLAALERPRLGWHFLCLTLASPCLLPCLGLAARPRGLSLPSKRRSLSSGGAGHGARAARARIPPCVLLHQYFAVDADVVLERCIVSSWPSSY